MTAASYDASGRWVPWTFTVVLAACGARSGLEAAPTAGDGRRDAGVDAGPPCVPTDEVCNAVDDDCDGRFDEGLGFGEVRHVVVRSTEGTTGPCSTCQWAAGPQLFVQLLRDPSGGEGVAVTRLDARGRRVDVWRPEPPTWFGLNGSDLVVDGGRIYFLHVGPAEDDLPNEVELHVLGCVE